MWDFLAKECGDRVAIVDPIHAPELPGGKRAPKGTETRLTYSEMRDNIGMMAAALGGLGLQKGVRLCRRGKGAEREGGGAGRRGGDGRGGGEGNF